VSVLIFKFSAIRTVIALVVATSNQTKNIEKPFWMP